MAVLVALNLSTNFLEVVTGETTSPGAIQILAFNKFPLPLNGNLSTNGTSPSENNGHLHLDPLSPLPHQEPPFDTPITSTLEKVITDHPSLEELLELDIDRALAVLPSRRMLFENIDLPFHDPKKVEKILPLQVQDLLPFEIDNFIVDAVSLGQKENNQYEYLASLVPSEDVSSALSVFSQLGIDPKMLTSYSSALTALAKLCPSYLTGSFGILLLDDNHCSLALFVQNELKHLRELTIEGNGEDLQALSKDIRCSLAHIERSAHETFEKIYLVGQQDLLAQVAKFLGRPVEMLDISSYVSMDSSLDISANDIVWAVGLFASELAKPHATQLINYRQGRFAYRPIWGNLIAALREEWASFTFLSVAFLLWVGSVFFASRSTLTQIDDRIQSEVRRVFPTANIPQQGEVEFLKEEVGKLEQQLRGLGSLSSLSPLESLKALSELLGEDLDITVDSLRLRLTSIQMQGSVSSTPAVGRLQGALEKQKDRFCKVQVDPGERVPGTSRVKFKAEISFSCDE